MQGERKHEMFWTDELERVKGYVTDYDDVFFVVEKGWSGTLGVHLFRDWELARQTAMKVIDEEIAELKEKRKALEDATRPGQ